MSNAIDVNLDNFATEVRDYSGPVLIDFWAPWCSPCRVMGPIVDQIANEMGDRIKVVKINIDQNPDLAMRYQVKGIPAFAVIQKGEIVDAHVGASTKAAFQMFVERALGENLI